MPLRDHFNPPLDDHHSWDALHAAWPTVIVMALKRKLPPGYIAVPHIHLGTVIEIDVASFEKELPSSGATDLPAGNGGTATAVWAPPKPGLDVATDLPGQDEYEVRVYDAKRDRRLVAAVEIVSRSNKDRPSERRAFAGKCAAMMRDGVSVAIVDLVTDRHANLYAELIDFLGQSDPALPPDPPSIYAAACRWTRVPKRARLQTWFHPLVLGHGLPVLPLWLSPVFAVQLELEPTYEEACSVVSIT
jgi:hypothetical protein